MAMTADPHPEGVKMQIDVIAIGGNSITIQIQWPTEITQDAYDDLVDYLALLQKRAKRAIKAAPFTSEDVPAVPESAQANEALNDENA